VCETVIALGLFVVLLAGCREKVDVVPVSGRITVDGAPLHVGSGVVNLVPNKEKGNSTDLQLVGVIDENGNYEVYYATKKKGAPLGWYKLRIGASPPELRHLPMPGERKRRKKEAPPPPPFDRKYMQVEKSGLEIEVVRNPAPEAYDLKRTK
jgi:hypothetical protein